jgi:hypothetical protein
MKSIGEILGSRGGTARRLVPLALPADRETLSEYQCLLREQIVFFEANLDDIEATAQGVISPSLLGKWGFSVDTALNLHPVTDHEGQFTFRPSLAVSTRQPKIRPRTTLPIVVGASRK